MKKKNLFVLAGISAALALGVASFTSINKGAFKLFADPVSKEYTVIFDSVQAGEYDEENYTYPLSFTQEIENNAKEKYSIESYDAYFTNYNNENTVFNTGGKLISFTEYSATIAVCFAIDKKATMDLDKSVIDMTINGVYTNTKFWLYDEDDAKYNLYYAEYQMYSNYGITNSIDSVKLVFSCVQ